MNFSRLQIYLKVTCLVSLIALSVSCGKKISPTPADTVVGSRAKQQRADYIATQELTNDELPLRSAQNFGAFDARSGSHLQNIALSVYFKFDNASIDSTERAKLQQFAEKIQQKSYQRILVIGHCDTYGTPDYNLPLGWRRANSVVDYLNSLGVPRQQIEALSRGDLDAKLKGSKAQTASDRRCDIKFVN